MLRVEVCSRFRRAARDLPVALIFMHSSAAKNSGIGPRVQAHRLEVEQLTGERIDRLERVGGINDVAVLS